MYIARFIIKTLSPLHCGGGIDFSFIKDLDQIADRDFCGLWRIQGSSIAGVLRDYIRQIDIDLANKLFGCIQSDGYSKSSLVWVNDAYLLDYDGSIAYRKMLEGREVEICCEPFIRDHVNIDLNKGTAVDGGKYDEEIVPPGVKFALELKLDTGTYEAEADELQGFLNLCAAIKQGIICLGGKQISGYGEFLCEYASVKKLDLKDENDLTAYLNLKDSARFEDSTGTEISLAEINHSVYAKKNLFSANLTIPLVSCGPLLAGGRNSIDEDVDMVCLSTPVFDYAKKGYEECYTLSGSALRGVIRHRVYDILLACDNSNDEFSVKEQRALQSLNKIFGCIHGDDSLNGHVYCHDIYLDKEIVSQRVQHVAIDRFTGGAIEGALFDEAPIWQKELLLNVRISLRELSLYQTALLMHAILDICLGEAAVGGGINRGNGILRLKDLEKGLETALKNVQCEAVCGDEQIDVSDQEQLELWLEILDEALLNGPDLLY